MSNSLNLTNIKNLLAAAYLSGVHDAFEKSKGLDTFSLQKNIEDSIQFRETLISELKNNSVAKPENILITAKAKGKELFCEKYPSEARCTNITPPTNKKNNSKETGFLSAITSMFSSEGESTKVNAPSPSTSTATVTTPTVTTPTVTTPVAASPKVNVPPPSLATVNASSLNPMIQSQPTVGGRKKNR
jgi:hypothetical protein